jgi:tRNA(Ile)-lysidine synthase
MTWTEAIHWHWPAGGVSLPDGSTLSAKTVDWDNHDPAPYLNANPVKEAWVNGIEGPLEVRQWQAGDRYQPLGAPGSRKLQDMFTDAKLHPHEKAAKPVIVDCSGSIIWVPGFPPADAFRICQNSNSALQLTYNPQLTVFPVYHGG